MRLALVNQLRCEAAPGLAGVCQVCSSPMIPKCGQLRARHWAPRQIGESIAMLRTRTIVTTLIAAGTLLAPAVAGAADPPDLKGRWVGKTHTIVAGKGGHWPSATGTLQKPGLFEKDLVLEIRGQEGRRL